MHAKLIAKLACYGINDILLYWIQSFLTYRFQYVKIGNSFSALHSVVSGVVQGTFPLGMKVKVKMHTLDIAPLRSESPPPQKRSGMVHVLKGFHSFA